jgi:hypothetical protein
MLKFGHAIEIQFVITIRNVTCVSFSKMQLHFSYRMELKNGSKISSCMEGIEFQLQFEDPS